MFLIPTTQAMHLAKKLAKFSGFKLVLPGLNRDQKRYFPDKELYVKIEEYRKLKGKRVVVLHSGAPEPQDGLVELELILQILKDADARPVEVFFTYFPYGMQDKVFDKGETNVAENLTDKLVSYYGVKRITVVDPHFWGRAWVKKYPIKRVSALPLLLEAAKKDFGKDILLVSPDKGAKRRSGVKIVKGLKKQRRSSYDVRLKSSLKAKKFLRGKVVAVADDILETGGTLVKFHEACQKAGAKKCLALITHGVLQKGIQRVEKFYAKLYLVNTLNQKAANVDVAPLLAKALLGR
ncbi:MAG: hypothetical protein G01um101430_585 [Parcubacteria group bacterium Gr01-1014_30]|nr:MAG: hypothetical protein G01um101430_585 [Parcubacteria group bacterium Gr01-1014_30]